jgi:hypothetical protein
LRQTSLVRSRSSKEEMSFGPDAGRNVMGEVGSLLSREVGGAVMK